MNVDVAKAGSTSYVGLATVLNMIAGLQVAPLQIAKLSTFGRESRFWAQPLGSFFPLGFLTPPDREPMVDFDYTFIPRFPFFYPPPFCFRSRGGEGVNLRITYASRSHAYHVLCLLIIVPFRTSYLIIPHHLLRFSLSTSLRIITRLISYWV